MYLVNKMTSKLCIPVIKNQSTSYKKYQSTKFSWKSELSVKKKSLTHINKHKKFLVWPHSEIIKYQDVMSMWFCLLSLAVRVMDNPLPITTKHNVWHSYIKTISILPKKQTTLQEFNLGMHENIINFFPSI